MRGTIPMSAGIFVTDYLRPAALKAGVAIPDSQRFGLHSFRSSLATLMVSVAKTDLKTARQLALEEPADHARQIRPRRDRRNGRRAGTFLGELWNRCGTAPVAITCK
jgi:hypothetical protein